MISFELKIIVGEDGVANITRNSEGMTPVEVIGCLEIEKQRWVNSAIKDPVGEVKVE